MPFAVALGVEHGWGEEFVGNILELLEVDQAYGAFANLLDRDGLYERERPPKLIEKGTHRRGQVP